MIVGIAPSVRRNCAPRVPRSAFEFGDKLVLVAVPSHHAHGHSSTGPVMCNLYANRTSQDLIKGLFPDRTVIDRIGNFEPRDGIYPDQTGMILRNEGKDAVLQMARWGMPSPPQFHSKSGIDRGVTNIRNIGSPHWRRWLKPEHRCLVPLSAFAEPAGTGKGNAWFRLAEDRPAMFAGLWVHAWSSIRKLKDGETTDDLYGFLTTEPNAEVAEIHPKAMPVILTDPDEWEAWLTVDWSDAKALQRPLTDGALVRESA